MDVAAGVWEVFVDFDVPRQQETGILDRLRSALEAYPEVMKAVPSMTDHGARMSVGATLILKADDAGSALNLAQWLVQDCAIGVIIALGRFREGVTRPAFLDPRG